MNTRNALLLMLAAPSAALRLSAQEKPLQVTGTFSTGYYSNSSRGDVNEDVRFVPLGAKFDINGWLLSPDFLNFTVQPELTLGPQASEAGFQGGNGVSLRATLLRKRNFPLTFRYSNVQTQDVYFGSLTQVSAYTLNNRTKDLGVTWELKPPGLPITTIDWGKGSVDSKSDIAQVPDYLSSMQHVNIDSRYSRWGWNFDGFAHWQDIKSDLFVPQNGNATTSSLTQEVWQYQTSAQRNLTRDSELYITAGDQSTASQLFTIPIDLHTKLASANLRLFQRHRWKTSLRANYTSNFSSQLLTQVISGLTAPGSLAPDPTVLAPLEQKIANLNLNAITSVDLSHGFGLFGSADQSSLLSSSIATPFSASYFTTSTGITYSGGFSWLRLSGQYARDFGNGSVTGQSGRISGQNYMISAQHGTPDRLQIDGSFHSSDQAIHNALPISSKSSGAEGSVSHNVIGSIRARAGGGWQWGMLESSGTQFKSSGYTARAGIEHRRVQVSAAINDSFGNSLPVYSQYVIYNPVAGGLFSTIPTIPSDFRAMTYTLHANPIRKMEVSAVWTRSIQHLDGILNNDFALLNIYGTYYYRRIQIETGYIKSNQIFLNYPDTRRGRFYVKISRTARIL